MIRVVLVDDHPAFLRGLAAMVAESGDIEVVATASTGRDAINTVADLEPDAVVMDLHMPDLDGVDATRAILQNHPNTAILALTMHDDDASLHATLDAGARGYLLKEASGDDIVRALHSITRGEVVFGRTIALHVLRQLRGTAQPGSPLPQLTSRELEILDHVARGCTNAQIAKALYLSDKTVRNHVSNILTKLNVPDRTAASDIARDAGLGRGPETPRWRDSAAQQDRHP